MTGFIYFWAGYCGYCKWARREIIEPLIEQGANIELINCMDNPDKAIKYMVKKIPTLVAVDGDGKELRRLERHAINEQSVKAMLGI